MLLKYLNPSALPAIPVENLFKMLAFCCVIFRLGELSTRHIVTGSNPIPRIPSTVVAHCFIVLAIV